MVSNIIENQHVAKRRKNPNLPNTTNKSAVFGNDFMKQFKQKPAHVKRGSFARTLKSGITHLRFKSQKKTSTMQATSTARAKNWPPEEKELKSSFSFPVPSLMTLAVIAGTLLVSLAALNWDGLSMTHNYVQPAPSEKSASPIVNYANTGSLSILPVSVVLTAESSPAVSPEIDISYTESKEIPLELIDHFEWSSYKVLRGDSVSKIASQFGISMDAVITSNEIRNARRLREGEMLRIPNMDGIRYTVTKGDSLSKISRSFNVPLEVILDANDIRSDNIKEGDVFYIPGARMAPDALRLSLGELFIFPVRRSISSGYGWRPDPFTGEQRFHNGIDLRSNIGVPVRAAMDGTVIDVGFNREYGNYIIINHHGGYQTLYAHLSVFGVKRGDRVAQGNKIGEVGNTGRSTGPHLHFSVFRNGRHINPLDLMS